MIDKSLASLRHSSGVRRRLVVLLVCASLFGWLPTCASAQSTGSITGAVTAVGSGSPLGGVSVLAFDTTGVQAATADTDMAGAYALTGLVAGAYYLATRNSLGYVDELYDDKPCAAHTCVPQAGRGVTVTAGAATGGIDFGLVRVSSITGTVTDADTNAGLAGVTVRVLDAVGRSLATTTTSAAGTYTLDSLVGGRYYVRTENALGYSDQLYKGQPCRYNSYDNSACIPVLGTVVSVAAGATTGGIDFGLVKFGAITGTVREAATNRPLVPVTVGAYDPRGGLAGSTTTDGSGVYTLNRLPPGIYFVEAVVVRGLPPPFDHDLLDEVYDGHPCAMPACTVTAGTAVVVNVGATTRGIDFALAARPVRGQITGTVTDAATHAALNVAIRVYDTSGKEVAVAPPSSIAGPGTYAVGGLPTGIYYVRTDSFGYVDELYHDKPCPGGACAVTTGTPVRVTDGATTGGIDFALVSAGKISGTVTDAATHAPLEGVSVSAYDASGRVVQGGSTDASGAYIVIGLPTGLYYVRTSTYSFYRGYLDALYENKPCPLDCAVTTGTRVIVTAGTTTSGIDFGLVKGGAITGSVTAAATGVGISGLVVSAYNASGTLVTSGFADGSGQYALSGLSTGTYYVRTSPTVFCSVTGCFSFGVGYIHELYDNTPCPGPCAVTSGTGVSVTTGATTSGIDFALEWGGSIKGVVTDAATSAPLLLGASVRVYDASGTLVTSSFSSSASYSVGGLTTGTYFVRASSASYVDALYDGKVCPTCPVTTGTAVSVTAGAATSGINLGLVAGGRIAGTVTDAGTGVPLQVLVKAYDTAGAEVASATTDTAGGFVLGGPSGAGLATGTYFVRTSNAVGYLDQLYSGQPCVNGACVPTITTGTGVAVTQGATTQGVDFGLVHQRVLTLSPSALWFGATKAGAASELTAVTAPQAVTVGFTGDALAWTAVADQPWVQITNGAGSAPGRLIVSVVNPGNVIAGSTSLSATITVTAASQGFTITVPVTLTVTPPTESAAPFGSFDTPANGAAGLAGSIAVTGWALDDVGIDRVEIWRDTVAGETTPGYAGSGPGHGKVFIANAFFVAGARPDVEAAYGAMPSAYRAGWGYLMLTQGLWNQGNGRYTLYAFAYDVDGHSATLGTKTITVDNAHAVTPFGTIDTPGYGQTVSGAFWNFGWALTPNAVPSCTIGPLGVQMAIDSGPLVAVGYGDLRPDIASAFPGFTNANGASGASYLDTTTLANGTHQIGWLVTDSCGRAEGVGSRFFTVLNAGTPGPAALADGGGARATVMPAASVNVAEPERASVTVNAPASGSGSSPRAADPMAVRRGGETTWTYPNPSGTRVVPIGQSERVEVQLPLADGGTYAGYEVVTGVRRALPLGSSLDAQTGVFYWQPATGFLGAHDLEFVVMRTPLQLGAAGTPLGGDNVVRVRAVVGTAVQMAIDTPAAGVVAGSFVVAGWAIDEAATSGTGIDTVHVWAYPATGAAPIFLGAAAYGDPRPDVGALFGEQFVGASYGLAVKNLARGTYDIVVYPHSAVTGDFHGAQAVRVTIP